MLVGAGLCAWVLDFNLDNLPIVTTKSTHDKQSHLGQISYRLCHGKYYTETFNPYMRCGDRQSLYAELHNTLGLFDFTTELSTSLKILVMGDSVDIQFSQVLEEAMGVGHNNDTASSSCQRTVYRYSWGTHEGLHISAPVRGGGVVAGWRITGMLSRSREGQPLPNAQGGGWMREDVLRLLNHTYNTTDGIVSQQVNNFDVLFFRIPDVWINLDAITNASLSEVVELASELFSVSTVIFTTVPFSNNIVTTNDLLKMADKNMLLHKFASNWQPGMFGVDRVFLLDLHQLTDGLLQWNMNHIGLDPSNTSDILAGLECCPNKGFYHHIGQMCAESVPPGSKTCERNLLSLDGVHQCMSVVGGRIFATLACVLECVGPLDMINGSTQPGWTCAQACNDRFLGLHPVAASELTTDCEP